MENLGFDWSQLNSLGIMGGTFDPIHYGHLKAAAYVRQAYNIDRIVFIPSGHPPHKTCSQISTPRDRYLMTLLATCDDPFSAVSQLELLRDGMSYTIHTIRTLRDWVGDECDLYFITGADMALDMVNWYMPDAIMNEARVVAVHRPGYDLSSIEKTFVPARTRNIEIIAADTPDISATDIRNRVRAGQSIAGLTPNYVVDYIKATGLFCV